MKLKGYRTAKAVELNRLWNCKINATRKAVNLGRRTNGTAKAMKLKKLRTEDCVELKRLRT
jgi:hypothetical protein